MTIQAIKLEDAQELFDLTNLNRSYLREWLPWVDSVTSLEHTVAFIKDCILTEEMGKTATYTIWHQGKLAGVCGFNTIDHDKKEAYIGYWLGEEFQGNGLMTMACSELERIAFESLALDSVIIRAAVKNLKSRAIPERLATKMWEESKTQNGSTITTSISQCIRNTEKNDHEAFEPKSKRWRIC